MLLRLVLASRVAPRDCVGCSISYSSFDFDVCEVSFQIICNRLIYKEKQFLGEQQKNGQGIYKFISLIICKIIIFTMISNTHKLP